MLQIVTWISAWLNLNIMVSKSQEKRHNSIYEIWEYTGIYLTVWMPNIYTNIKQQTTWFHVGLKLQDIKQLGTCLST